MVPKYSSSYILRFSGLCSFMQFHYYSTVGSCMELGNTIQKVFLVYDFISVDVTHYLNNVQFD